MSTYTKPSRRQTWKPDDFQHGQASGASRGARLGALRDVAVTESRDAAGAQFRTVLDGAAIGIAVLDSHDRIIDSKLALREMLGYDADEIATLTFRSLIHPDGVDAGRNLYEQLTGNDSVHYEVEKRYIRKDGQLIWCHVTAALAQATDSAAPEVIVTPEDTTERRWLEGSCPGLGSGVRVVSCWSPTSTTSSL